MPASFTLGKNERLKRRKIIEQLFADGKSINAFPLRLQYLLCESLPGPLQAGFSVSSRQFKKAVDRNRIKRLLREAYRLQKNTLCDCLMNKQQQLALFVIYTGKEMPDFETVSEKTKLILQKLVRIANEIPASNT